MKLRILVSREYEGIGVVKIQIPGRLVISTPFLIWGLIECPIVLGFLRFSKFYYTQDPLSQPKFYDDPLKEEAINPKRL